MGPFYCPNDRKVYLDTSFFQDLERRFRACRCRKQVVPILAAYVIAHEIGHHVAEPVWHFLPKVQQVQQSLDKSRGNQVQVRVECRPIACGVWAHNSQERGTSSNLATLRQRCRLPRPSAATGLQRRARATWPDAFTHGSSQQRTRFHDGAESGNMTSANHIQRGTALSARRLAGSIVDSSSWEIVVWNIIWIIIIGFIAGLIARVLPRVERA